MREQVDGQGILWLEVSCHMCMTAHLDGVASCLRSGKQSIAQILSLSPRRLVPVHAGLLDQKPPMRHPLCIHSELRACLLLKAFEEGTKCIPIFSISQEFVLSKTMNIIQMG